MMTGVNDPASYEAWYHTPRGHWLGQREFSLLMQLMQPGSDMTVLDVGSGTGYFSRLFSSAGLHVTGIEPDPAMIKYARAQAGSVDYLEGQAQQLPFDNNSFDYTTAITSLCFIKQPVKALVEMWRVSRYGVVLGLLNRDSLLYRQKHDRGGYVGARWDSWPDVKNWIASLIPHPLEIRHKSAIIFPGAGVLARVAEHLLPGVLPWGGFLAVCLMKQNRTTY